MNKPEFLRHPLPDIILSGLLFLFFFQLLSDFIASIYAFGLLKVSLTLEIAYVIFLLSPVILLFLPLRGNRTMLTILGFLIVVAYILEINLDTRGRMIAGGFGTGCFLIYFVLQLLNQDGQSSEDRARIYAAGLGIGLILSTMMRVPGSGNDNPAIAATPLGWWLLGLLALSLLIFKPGPNQELPADSSPRPGGITWFRLTILSMGISGIFLLVYFAFFAPNVMARWTGEIYPLVMLLPVLSLIVIGALAIFARRFWLSLTLPVMIAWNCIFILTLVATIALNQVKFPTVSSAYPLAQPPDSLFSPITLAITLALFPVLLIDLSLFTREIMTGGASRIALGVSFSLACLFLLIMIFAQVFTTVYDYIPVIGPFFRDKFWLVFLVAGLAASLPVLLVRQPGFIFQPADVKPSLIAIAIFCLPVLSIGVDLRSTSASPVAQPAQTSLRVLTYNVQQGYSANGQHNLAGQLGLIQALNRSGTIDLIGLQETDTTRISGGNTDIVRYFADRLNLYSYYGPKTVTGTFGIALLSRYPILNPRTYYLYSLGEQTAAIVAQIQVNGRIFDVIVTHLGNSGPVIQQQEVLELAQGKDDLILMGDFNFEPATAQYLLTTRSLVDSWLVGGSRTQGDAPFSGLKRIDYIYVTPRIHITTSSFITQPESDHPALVTDISW